MATVGTAHYCCGAHCIIYAGSQDHHIKYCSVWAIQIEWQHQGLLAAVFDAKKKFFIGMQQAFIKFNTGKKLILPNNSFL